MAVHPDLVTDTGDGWSQITASAHVVLLPGSITSSSYYGAGQVERYGKWINRRSRQAALV
ncbi:hypothetical protein [Salinispora arenicola]|uniref:hypothetical protein n=1 Tax=Salinispora arenicola TaxID=168697 RepID=UPI0016B68A26|nr:hypothetical protein [Salinispora arenicola]NIL64754.1 hypothetical protein [Salinispora arenicola]